MLTSAELTAMRSHAGTIALTQTAIIESMTETVDAIGDPVRSWAAIGTVPCHIQEMQRAAVNPVDGRIVFGQGWVGYLEYDATVSLGNRMVVTVESASRIFQVVGISDAMAWPIVKRLQLEELR